LNAQIDELQAQEESRNEEIENMIIKIIMAIAILVCHTLAIQVYKIEGLDEYGDRGSFTLTASKEF